MYKIKLKDVLLNDIRLCRFVHEWLLDVSQVVAA